MIKDESRDIHLKHIQELRKDFINFTNVYWFHDVTAQTQGQEIFKKQQQALELQREYEFIKEEMARLDEFLQGNFNSRLNRVMTRFTIASVFLAFTQIFISTEALVKLRAFMSSFDDIIKTVLGLNVPAIASKLMSFTQGISVIVSIFLGVIAFCLLLKEIRKKR